MGTASTLEHPSASQSAVSTHDESQPIPESRTALFSQVEVRQFESDDEAAGRRIGKILAALFVYTVIAMSIVTWWTFSVAK